MTGTGARAMQEAKKYRDKTAVPNVCADAAAKRCALGVREDEKSRYATRKTARKLCAEQPKRLRQSRIACNFGNNDFRGKSTKFAAIGHKKEELRPETLVFCLILIYNKNKNEREK